MVEKQNGNCDTLRDLGISFSISRNHTHLLQLNLHLFRILQLAFILSPLHLDGVQLLLQICHLQSKVVHDFGILRRVQAAAVYVRSGDRGLSFGSGVGCRQLWDDRRCDKWK